LVGLLEGNGLLDGIGLFGGLGWFGGGRLEDGWLPGAVGTLVGLDP
jgi:hypothetical protein